MDLTDSGESTIRNASQDWSALPISSIQFVPPMISFSLNQQKMPLRTRLRFSFPTNLMSLVAWEMKTRRVRLAPGHCRHPAELQHGLYMNPENPGLACLYRKLEKKRSAAKIKKPSEWYSNGFAHA